MSLASAESKSTQLEVSSVLIRALLDVSQSRGVGPEALLDRDAAALSAEPAAARVSLEHFQTLLERAIELTGEPALGLECGLQASECSFGLMGPLVSHAQTLRHAFALVTQFGALLSEQVRIELSEELGTAHLTCALHAQTSRSMTELIVAGLVRMLRTFGCASREIYAVAFEHGHPAHHHAYRAAFGGVERFGQPSTSIEFSAMALDRPHLHWQPELQAVMRAQAERAIEQLSRPLTCTERVVAYLQSLREPHVPDMAVAARELGLGLRSLRRRLEEEGTSYRVLSQSRLFESACSMLRNPALTLQAIAHELGFSNASTFHRAFSRWAGLTPMEYRRSALSGSVATSAHTALPSRA